MSAVNPCDPMDERRAAGFRQVDVPVTNSTVLVALKCQEASIHSREFHIPCGAPAEAVIWHERDKLALLMCAPCAWHNVENRGGRLLMTTNDVVLK